MPEKTIICPHHENIVSNIGTCIHCGQVRDYTGKKVRVLKRGEINGVLTEINPPEQPPKKGKKARWPLKSVTDRLGSRSVKRF